jgi:hypothetical protein
MTTMPGQGNALPDFLDIKGQWIIENSLFIYVEPAPVEGGLSPRYVRTIEREDGVECIGFDVDQLAALFDTDRTAIFAANQVGGLIFLGVANRVPDHGAFAAVAYGFCFNGENNELVIKSHDHQGSA